MGFATGTFVVTPRLIAPAKNSTVATSSSTSSACAINVILAGAANFAPLMGLTILTCGGKFVTSPSSAILTTALLGQPTTYGGGQKMGVPPSPSGRKGGTSCTFTVSLVSRVVSTSAIGVTIMSADDAPAGIVTWPDNG